jgi:predicted glutamine amidotransferase
LETHKKSERISLLVEMCRMFLQIGKKLPNLTYMEYIESCADYVGQEKKDIHERNISSFHDHRDGYGFAVLNKGHFALARYIEPIFERDPVSEWEKLQTEFLLAHARRASPGLKINITNNHPFYWYDYDREYVFSHNGTIKSNIKNYDDRKYFLRSSTDSEPYFYALLTKLESNDWDMNENIVKETIEDYDYTGANFFLSTPSKSWVGVYYRTNPKYFTMKLYKKEDSVVVSSALLPSLGEPTEILTNGSLIEIDMNSKQYYYLV